MAPRKQKPPTQSQLEREAREFKDRKEQALAAIPDPPKRHREVMTASILSGLLAGPNRASRPSELVQEAFNYADMILKHED